MKTYLKRFQNHTAYQSYATATGTFIKPNVSYCVQEHDSHITKDKEQILISAEIEQVESDQIQINIDLPGDYNDKVLVEINNTIKYFVNATDGKASGYLSIDEYDAIVDGNNTFIITAFDTEHFIGTTISETVSIDKIASPLSVEIGEGRIGEPIVIVATAPAGATGQIQLTYHPNDSDSPLNFYSNIIDCKATFNLQSSTFGVGWHTLSIFYPGDSNYLSGHSTCWFTVDE